MLSPGTHKVRILLQLAAKKDGKSDTLLSNFSKWAYFIAISLTKDEKNGEFLSLVTMLLKMRIFYCS